MDRRARQGDPLTALRAAMDTRAMQIWTVLPGIIQSFNAVAMTAVVQIAIQGSQTDIYGNVTPVTITPLVDCPVKFPSGGGFTLTFPLVKGDECLVHFSARCIDAWWQLGGVRPQLEYRIHDLSDGFCDPKVWSQPNVLSNVSTSTVQLRSDDGACYVELAAGHVANIVAPGGLNITGPVNINGNITTTGTITNNGHAVDSTHKHGGVQTGGGQTGVPV